MIYKGNINDIPQTELPKVVMQHGDVRYVLERNTGKVRMEMNVAGFWGGLHRSNPNEYEWIDRMVRSACIAAAEDEE